MNDKFLWDDYFYDRNNERIINTGFIKIGKQSFYNGAINMKMKR